MDDRFDNCTDSISVCCPVCGQQLQDDEKIFMDEYDSVVGCEKCLTARWAEILIEDEF